MFYTVLLFAGLGLLGLIILVRVLKSKGTGSIAGIKKLCGLLIAIPMIAVSAGVLMASTGQMTTQESKKEQKAPEREIVAQQTRANAPEQEKPLSPPAAVAQKDLAPPPAPEADADADAEYAQYYAYTETMVKDGVVSEDEARKMRETYQKSFGTRKEPADRAIIEDPDKRQVRQWLEAAKKGDIQAFRQLGATYELGSHGQAKNFLEAIKWYKRAAERGDAEAPFSIAMIYQADLDEWPEAYVWWLISLARGDERARHHIDSWSENITAEEMANARRVAAAWLKRNNI